MQEAAGQSNEAEAPPVVHDTTHAPRQGISLRRLFSYSRREALELRRDPGRSTLALMGTVILMLIMGYGISKDVENLRFAVLDRDQTVSSQARTLNLSGSRNFIEQPPLTSYDELDRPMRAGDIKVEIELPPNYGRDIARGTPVELVVWIDGAMSGSRYFIEQPPLTSYDELDRRMRAGDITVAIEIPPNFGRDIARGTPVELGVWIDGAMPSRAETVKGYVQAMHQSHAPELATGCGEPTVHTRQPKRADEY